MASPQALSPRMWIGPAPRVRWLWLALWLLGFAAEVAVLWPVVFGAQADAASLPAARATAFERLKIEAIGEAPVSIVVTCDPTRGGRHTLGRHSQPQTAAYSSVLAVSGLWLCADGSHAPGGDGWPPVRN